MMAKDLFNVSISKAILSSCYPAQSIQSRSNQRVLTYAIGHTTVPTFSEDVTAPSSPRQAPNSCSSCPTAKRAYLPVPSSERSNQSKEIENSTHNPSTLNMLKFRGSSALYPILASAASAPASSECLILSNPLTQTTAIPSVATDLPLNTTRAVLYHQEIEEGMDERERSFKQPSPKTWDWGEDVMHGLDWRALGRMRIGVFSFHTRDWGRRPQPPLAGRGRAAVCAGCAVGPLCSCS